MGGRFEPDWAMGCGGEAMPEGGLDAARLEELPPVEDERFGTLKYSYRHGTTTISLRSFGKSLPADTGSGGIQYVVSDVEYVDTLAKERHITIDQPLAGLRGFDLRTIWLDDPDGVTNYFAETGASRRAREARSGSQ